MGNNGKLVTLALFLVLSLFPIATFSQMQINLIENERYSPFDARAVIELITPANINAFSSTLGVNNFNFSLDRFRLSSHAQIDTIKQTDLDLSPMVEVETAKTELVEFVDWRKKPYNVTICPNVTEKDCYVKEVMGEEPFNSSYLREYTAKEWVPLYSIVLKPSATYKVKLESHNLDKDINYDWVLTSNGISYKQWAWWNNTFLYKQKIQINSTTATALTYFPVRLMVNTSALIASGAMNASCKDLRIVDGTETYMLAYEIENNTCNSVYGTWVYFAANLTQGIGAGQANTTAYLYYGSNITADAQNSALLWNQSGYIRVYHFGEATLSNSVHKAVRDSSQYNDHAMTAAATPTPFLNTSSKFGYGLNYGVARDVAGKWVNFSNPNFFSTAAWTIEMWAYDWLAGAGTEGGLYSSYAIASAPYGSYASSDWGAPNAGKIGSSRDGATTVIRTAALSSKTYSLYTFTGNGTTASAIWVNGTLRASGTDAVFAGSPFNGYNRIGIGVGGAFEGAHSSSFAGYIDEFRVSTSSKTADWNKANFGLAVSLEPVQTSASTPVITITPSNQTLNMTNNAIGYANVTTVVSGDYANLTLYVLNGVNNTAWINTSSLTNFMGTFNAIVQINTTYNAQGLTPVMVYVNSSTSGVTNKSAIITVNATFVSVCTSGFAYSHIRTGMPVYAGEPSSLMVFYANEFGIPASASTCRLTIINSNGVVLSNLSLSKMSSGIFAQNYTFNDTGDYYLMSNCECESTIGSDASIVHVGTLRDVVKAIVKYEDGYREQYEIKPSAVTAPIFSFGWLEISLGGGVLLIIVLLLYNAYRKR